MLFDGIDWITNWRSRRNPVGFVSWESWLYLVNHKETYGVTTRVTATKTSKNNNSARVSRFSVNSISQPLREWTSWNNRGKDCKDAKSVNFHRRFHSRHPVFRWFGRETKLTSLERRFVWCFVAIIYSPLRKTSTPTERSTFVSNSALLFYDVTAA